MGKSTFIEALGKELTENRGKKLAVLTIDPTSAVTGGIKYYIKLLSITLTFRYSVLLEMQKV